MNSCAIFSLCSVAIQKYMLNIINL